MLIPIDSINSIELKVHRLIIEAPPNPGKSACNVQPHDKRLIHYSAGGWGDEQDAALRRNLVTHPREYARTAKLTKTAFVSLVLEKDNISEYEGIKALPLSLLNGQIKFG